MTPVERLLDALGAAGCEPRESNRTGEYRARCPAHDGTSRRTLAVREVDNGRVLLHDFAGCDVSEVTGALGLDLSDLFPAEDRVTHSIPAGRRWIPRTVLSAVYDEALIVWTCAEILATGGALHHDDLARLGVAARRLRAAAREVNDGQ